MSMKKIIFAVVLIMALACAVCAYSSDVMQDLENGIVRLHVIANSDSDEDQAVKLKVRDAVLKAVEGGDISDPEQLRATAQGAAEQTLRENGAEYGACTVYGMYDFPEKSYRGITLPAGEYNGIRVILGSGSGHNWWCVLYPPLCVSDGEPELSEESKKQLREQLRDDTFDIVTDSSEKKVKLRIVEAAVSILYSMEIRTVY